MESILFLLECIVKWPHKVFLLTDIIFIFMVVTMAGPTYRSRTKIQSKPSLQMLFMSECVYQAWCSFGSNMLAFHDNFSHFP